MANYSFLEKAPLDRMNRFKEHMDHSTAGMPKMSPAIKRAQEWNPYAVQGGTCAAIAGSDFVVVASDTRMSQAEVNILTRNCEKIYPLSSKILLGTCGYYGDVLELKRLLQSRLEYYAFQYQHDMPVDLCAEMLARSLYYRRFFPYYTGSILCGIDEAGKGAVYCYDPVGNIERRSTDTAGAGGSILQSFLDNQVDFATLDRKAVEKQPKLTLERAQKLLRDAFRVLAERETSTGDGIKLFWIKAGDDQIYQESLPLRED